MKGERSGIMEALRQFDATEANLGKVERLWGEVESMIPSDVQFGQNVQYEERLRALTSMIEALPSIDGWALHFDTYDWNDIAHIRMDASEAGELESHVYAEKILILQPASQIREYRARFTRKRRALARDALAKLVAEVDAAIVNVHEHADLGNSSTKMEGKPWDVLRAHLDQIAVLLGSSSKGLPRWGDLRRHLGFGLVQDFEDIERFDWPVLRERLLRSLYDENEPIPITVRDLSELTSAKPQGVVVTRLNWEVLDDEGFEGVLFALISTTAGYENVQWLTRTRAADRGRDLSADRVVKDELSGVRRERVIFQCRHLLRSSVSMADVALLKEQMPLHNPAPDELVIVTSGRFTADVVATVETQNVTRASTRISLWPDSHLERILAERPEITAEFHLR
ncbi:MAG TPA: restriction endonuclease [Candidatus Cybelea sp.]